MVAVKSLYHSSKAATQHFHAAPPLEVGFGSRDNLVQRSWFAIARIGIDDVANTFFDPPLRVFESIPTATQPKM
jgi:hypothetical protein